MSAADDPINVYPDFAFGSDAQLAAPSAALASSGYLPGSRPNAQNLNFLLNAYGRWIRALAGQANSTTYATTLDGSARMTGGGTWAFSAQTGVLVWSSAITITFPGVPSGSNVIPAGQVTLADGQLACVQANVPLDTTAVMQAQSATVEVSFNGGIAQGMTVTGSGIPAGTTVSAPPSGNTVTLSAAATISQTSLLTFGGTGALSVTAVTPATFQPNSNSIVFAIRSGAMVGIGVNANFSIVRDAETKLLHGANGFGMVQQCTAGVAMSNPRQAVYISDGSNGLTAGAIYPCQADNTSTAISTGFIGFTSAPVASGATVGVVQSGTMTYFSSLSTGATYWLSTTTQGGIQATKPSGVGQWAVPVGVALNASTLLISPRNTQGIQVYPAVTASTVSVTGSVTANSFTSAQGFVCTIPMGTIYNSGSVQGTANQSAWLGIDTATSSTSYMPYSFMAERAGSLISLECDLMAGPNSVNVSTILFVTINFVRAGTLSFPFGASTSQANYRATFAKGQYPFNSGDVIRVYGQIQSNTGAPSGTNLGKIQAVPSVGVEYSA